MQQNVIQFIQSFINEFRELWCQYCPNILPQWPRYVWVVLVRARAPGDWAGMEGQGLQTCSVFGISIGKTWRFPKMGVPLNLSRWMFHHKPSMNWGTLMTMETPDWDIYPKSASWPSHPKHRSVSMATHQVNHGLHKNKIRGQKEHSMREKNHHAITGVTWHKQRNEDWTNPTNQGLNEHGGFPSIGAPQFMDGF